MKLFIFSLLSISLLFSATIDTKLFDQNSSASYYKEIEGTIAESESKKIKSDETINTEKAYLKKLTEVSSKKVLVSEFNPKAIEKKGLNIETLSTLVVYLSETKIKIEKQQELSSEVQNRLSYLKKLIENITEESKEALLSYQLQFAYYKIQKSNIQTRVTLLEKKQKDIYDYLSITLPKLAGVTKDKYEKEFLQKEEKIKKLKEQRASYEIELEKESIEENQKSVDTLKTNISTVEASLQKEYGNLFEITIKKVLISLNKDEKKEYLNLSTKLDEILDKMDSESRHTYTKAHNILRELAKSKFGNTNLFIGSYLNTTKEYLLELKKLFTTTLFVFNEQAINLLSILKFIFLIVLGFVIGKIYKRWLHKISTRWPNMSQMSLKLSSNVGYYLIILITFMIAISSLGIDMSSISLIAGALSIGIGFGLQTVVSNFISGIILMFERTIRIGDIIEIDTILKGTVTDIRIRSTTIKTFDNIDIVVPNSSFIQNNVINWTLEDPTRRLRVPFGVAYGTNIEELKKIILKELFDSNLVFIRNDKTKEPDLRFELMNSSSIDFELLVWVKVNDKLRPNALRSDFLVLIYNALYKHSIEIPFPQLDLHVKDGIHKD